MTPSDGHGLAFAGLYEFWGEPGELLTTTTIVTAEATGRLAEVHDRMPLVLPPSAWSRWLDPAVADPAELLAAWDEAEGEHLELRPVGSQRRRLPQQRAGADRVRRARSRAAGAVLMA